MKARIGAWLVSDSRAGRPSFVARAIEPAVANRNQFDRTPGPLLDEFVTNLGQLADNRGRQAGRLVIDQVGARLMMDPGRVDGVLWRHTVIDNVHYRQQHGADDARAPRA